MVGRNSQTNSAERMMNLVALLTESSTPLTFDEICNRMRGQYPEKAEARRTAFEREKRTLRRLGIPFTTQVLGGDDAGRTAYSIDRSEYKLIDFELTPDEMSALQQAAAMVQIGTTWGKRAVQWLGGEVSSTAPTSAAHIEAKSAALPELFDACSTLKIATFEYHGRPRVVHPYGLIARNGFWYLIAFDTDRQSQVTYRVDRIVGDITLGAADSFTRPSDFNLETAYNRDPKGFAGDAEEKATVRLDPRVAPGVVRELGDEAVLGTNDGGFVDVLVPCGNRSAFRSWLYAMVDRAVVIAPENVRNEIIADLQRMAGGAQ
jgi:predicted DNA-binding transcriptional regulator YafY